MTAAIKPKRNTPGKLISGLAGSLLMASTLSAQVFEYGGQTQAANITNHDWVLGSKMWGTIEAGSGVGTSSDGFTSLANIDISKFTFTFGDLELTNFLEPGPASAGFEVYSEGDGSVQPIQFFYDGNLWASGDVFDITINVDNSNDATAVGTSRVQLTAPGVDAAFYNEVIALSGGTGLLDFQIADFFPVDDAGLFSSTGSVSPVPEPSTYALVFGMGIAGFAVARRLRRAQP